jgi:hypothetical protein
VEALRATLAHRLNHSTIDGPASTAADNSMICPKTSFAARAPGEATAYFLPPRRDSDAGSLAPGNRWGLAKQGQPP